MTPAEVSAMTLDEHEAFQEAMAAELRQQERTAQRARSRSRRGRRGK